MGLLHSPMNIFIRDRLAFLIMNSKESASLCRLTYFADRRVMGWVLYVLTTKKMENMVFLSLSIPTVEHRHLHVRVHV